MAGAYIRIAPHPLDNTSSCLGVYTDSTRCFPICHFTVSRRGRRSACGVIYRRRHGSTIVGKRYVYDDEARAELRQYVPFAGEKGGAT
ncbi:hypothetical protein JN531_012635 [Flagellatimonas centrodinii]|uniref:hypothetical protein n=1 Tax=Flagellatimonas centrodinii TaxID=2806210 RepID=UPI001FEE598A|nr:hypothetical protein [Flagellatimonas centrodinii]ULQ45946.1 hypothetical protein JN531_012635 [Flagellatimonas centrodinii]